MNVIEKVAKAIRDSGAGQPDEVISMIYDHESITAAKAAIRALANCYELDSFQFPAHVSFVPGEYMRFMLQSILDESNQKETI